MEDTRENSFLYAIDPINQTMSKVADFILQVRSGDVTEGMYRPQDVIVAKPNNTIYFIVTESTFSSTRLIELPYNESVALAAEIGFNSIGYRTGRAFTPQLILLSNKVSISFLRYRISHLDSLYMANWYFRKPSCPAWLQRC